MYYLILSGIIQVHNQREFEATCKLVSEQMPEVCRSHDIYKKDSNKSEYCALSYWNTLEDLKQYKSSPAYLIISGAFATLGELSENMFGITSDFQKNKS